MSLQTARTPMKPGETLQSGLVPCVNCRYYEPRNLMHIHDLCYEGVENHGAADPEILSHRTCGCSEGGLKKEDAESE